MVKRRGVSIFLLLFLIPLLGMGAVRCQPSVDVPQELRGRSFDFDFTTSKYKMPQNDENTPLSHSGAVLHVDFLNDNVKMSLNDAGKAITYDGIINSNLSNGDKLLFKDIYGSAANMRALIKSQTPFTIFGGRANIESFLENTENRVFRIGFFLESYRMFDPSGTSAGLIKGNVGIRFDFDYSNPVKIVHTARLSIDRTNSEKGIYLLDIVNPVAGKMISK